MNRFAAEPPELEPVMEDFYSKIECDYCMSSEMAKDGEIPEGWGIRGRHTLCPDCLVLEDRSEARFDAA